VGESGKRRADRSTRMCYVDVSILVQLITRNLGHGLPALCDGRPTLAQSFEVVPQVLAVGVIRDCHSEKTAGLEFAPEPLGQLGHFHRIANRLFPLVELLVASPKPVDFSFLAAQLRGLSRLPVLLRQQDKPVNGRRIGRSRHEQAFQLSAFRSTSPCLEASQALSRWSWSGIDSAAGRCVTDVSEMRNVSGCRAACKITGSTERAPIGWPVGLVSPLSRE